MPAATAICGAAAVAGPAATLDGIVDAVLQRRSAVAHDPAIQASGARSALVARLAPFDEAPWLTTPERQAPAEHRLLLAVVRMALADAAVVTEGRRVGLVIGTSTGAMGELARGLRGAPADLREGTYFGPSAWTARALGVQGPVHTVSSACASGAIALVLAADLVESGEVDLAIAAGFDRWSDFVHAGFDALGALSARPPAPFRADRSGLVLGEAGAAAIVGAGRPRRGVLLGAGLSGDARHITAPDREGTGLARAIEAALADAALPIDAIDLVGAHGTGTIHNDAAESQALLRALGPRARELPVHTIKPIVGHTLGAAGLLEALVLCACLARGLAPPTLTSDATDPDCPLWIPTAAPVPLARAQVGLKLSSGFGGSNAALVLGCGSP